MSAWGNAWGVAWGNAWGQIVVYGASIFRDKNHTDRIKAESEIRNKNAQTIDRPDNFADSRMDNSQITEREKPISAAKISVKNQPRAKNLQKNKR